LLLLVGGEDGQGLVLSTIETGLSWMFDNCGKPEVYG